jgi:hypothetical protein
MTYVVHSLVAHDLQVAAESVIVLCFAAEFCSMDGEIGNWCFLLVA